jgi:hypothetical protein
MVHVKAFISADPSEQEQSRYRGRRAILIVVLHFLRRELDRVLRFRTLDRFRGSASPAVRALAPVGDDTGRWALPRRLPTPSDASAE